MKLILLILIIIVSQYSIFAQVNIERFRKSQSHLGFGGEADIRFTVQAGNTDLQILKGQFRLNYNGGDYYSFAVVGGDYGWQKGEQISNEALLHLRFVKTLTNLMQLEVFGQTDYSNPRKLLIRKLAGTGLRFRLLKQEGFRLSLGTGIMYETEKYNLPEESFHSHNTKSFRSTNYVNVEIKFNEQVSFYSIIYYQPDIELPADYKFIGENGFYSALGDNVSLAASFAFRYDNRPPDAIKNYDINTSLGLVLSF